MSKPFGLGCPEIEYLHRCIAAAYDVGGNVDEDNRLISICYKLLDLVGWDGPLPPFGVLEDIRASVKRGDRLPELRKMG